MTRFSDRRTAAPPPRGGRPAPADTQAVPELARFTDALGRRVTAEPTRSGLLALLTRTVDEGLNVGHPCLSRENARELGEALLAFADRGPS